MALSLRYVGARPYTEFRINGITIGFSRGMVRDDIDETFITTKIMPMIANGSKSWVVEGADAKTTKTQKKMLEALEPEVVEAPVVEEVVEEEVITTPEAVTMLDVEALLEAEGFSSSLTRAQMMAWCSARDIKTANTSTKASMTDLAREHVAGSN
jgi:hypothetical protein